MLEREKETMRSANLRRNVEKSLDEDIKRLKRVLARD